MKTLKRTFFAMIFLGGFSTMAINSSNEGAVQVEKEDPISCTTIYTLCDYGNPDSHDGFLSCMDRNGCG